MSGSYPIGSCSIRDPFLSYMHDENERRQMGNTKEVGNPVELYQLAPTSLFMYTNMVRYTPLLDRGIFLRLCMTISSSNHNAIW